jgi:hypothetical protein
MFFKIFLSNHPLLQKQNKALQILFGGFEEDEEGLDARKSEKN